MFKLKYSFIAAIQALAGIATVLGLLKNFGTSTEAANYLLAFTIISFAQPIMLMVNEQFIHDFHKIRVNSRIKADFHYWNFISISLFISIIIAVLFIACIGSIVEIVASELAQAERDDVKKLLKILTLSMLVYIPNQINQQYLAATERIALSYLPTIIPSIATAVSMNLAIMIGYSIGAVVWIYAISTVIALLTTTVIAKPKISLNLRYFKIAIRPALIRSVKIRSAHNIYNVSYPVILSNYAAGLTTDGRALFLYSKKIAETFMSIVFGPAQRILLNEMSLKHDSVDFLSKLKIKIKDFEKKMIYVHFLGMILIPVCPVAIELIFKAEIKDVQILTINLFVFMLQGLLMAKEIPYAIICAGRNEVKTFVFANTLFLLILLPLIHVFNIYLKSYSFAIAALLSQLAVFVVIRHKGKFLLDSVAR